MNDGPQRIAHRRPQQPCPARVDGLALALETHRDFRNAWRRGFCYLCGKPLASEVRNSPDHVPPKALFGKQDRDPPLILPTHFDCNQNRSQEDEIIGQLEMGRYRTTPEIGFVWLYYLVPEARGTGVSQRLDEYVAQFYSDLGLRQARLNVNFFFSIILRITLATTMKSIFSLS